MENIWFSRFTIKGNGGAYEVCLPPNIRPLENLSQHILQLDPGAKI